MRPTPLRFALAAVTLAVAAGFAPAQFGFAPKAKIDKIRIGFRPTSGGDRDQGAAVDPVCKVGLWAPVSVGVEFDKMKGYKKGILLEVTSIDCDELRTLARFPIIPEITADADSDEYLRERGPGMRKEPSELTNTAYVKLPSDSAEVRLRLVQEDDPEKALSETEVRFRTGARPTSKYVILTLGGKLGGLDFARKDLYGSRVEQAHLDSVEELPDQWFGYEAADLVVLPTGGPTPEFIARLFNSTDPSVARKRRALFEWVRRGGKLVVSAGDRAAEVAASPEFAGYTDKASGQWTPGPLPVLVSPTPKVNSLTWDKAATPTPLSGHEVKYTDRTPKDTEKAGVTISLGGLGLAAVPAKLKPSLFAVAALKDNPLKTPHTVLLRGKPPRGEEAAAAGPLVVQAPFGLGRVTVVAFDLDRSPFADDSNRIARTELWEWLVAEAGDREAAKVPTEQQRANAVDNQPIQPGRRGQVNPPPNYSADRNTEDGVVAALRGSVDHYDEVPVISFGWVALFILGYTLLIGPIEYILLKKLLGKLELTWITFPIIVLSVSGAAYLTAYAVKGKDLRMNKIDVVDIDVRTDPTRPRVYGRTWFTIFSPRIDSYTVGVEPKANWATQRDDKGYTPVTTVDGFGIPKAGGVTAGSRGYTYEIDPRGDNSPQANGVSGVPIQVWSTKAFAANWSGVADPTAPPVTADLRMLPEGGRVAGTVKYNLTLKDVDQAYLAYRGKVYPFEKAVVPGVPVTLAVDWTKPELDTVFQNDPKFVYREQGEEDFGWGGGRNRTQQKTATAADAKNPLNLWGLLFHEKATVRGNVFQNGTLRPLDQSWRLDDANTGEVILLFKLKRASKQEANELMTATDSPSPTKVWLHGLPGRGTDKWAVDGIVQQDTYVRMYLPVKPAGAK
jgi:hypothetical protein